MKINIQNDLNDSDKSLEEDIQRKLRLALSKVATNISSITFSVSDVIGQSGKYDNQCSIVISLHNMANIVIEETQPDLYFCIDRVIQKATRTISRKLLY